jgi:hypothetical protein
MEPRLKTGLVVQAALRVATTQAISFMVVRRGDADAGAILIKLNYLGQGFAVLAQTRTLEGELVWMRATGADAVDEPTADVYIERQVKRDPDLWVVEIEDRAGRHFFAGRVL